MSNLHTEEMLPIKCGTMSLIGAMGERPLSWGNYFWLQAGPRVANFWWENLEAADTQFSLGGMVKVRRYRIASENNRPADYCLIDDDRIPKDWYYNKLCFTGTYPPPIEVIEDMYAYLGDPNNELEQYINPESYWEKHDATYKNGIIIFKPKFDDPSKSVIIGLKGKITTEPGYFYAPYIPKYKVKINE